jgi:TctA family transporter
MSKINYFVPTFSTSRLQKYVLTIARWTNRVGRFVFQLGGLGVYVLLYVSFLHLLTGLYTLPTAIDNIISYASLIGAKWKKSTLAAEGYKIFTILNVLQ